MARIWIECLVVTWITLCPPVLGAVNWVDVNKSLAKCIIAAQSVEGVTNNALISGLIQQRNKPALLEMCFQRQYSAVVVAGLFGIQKIDSNAVYSTALRIAWNSDKKGDYLLLSFLFPCLSQKVDKVVFRNAFSPVMQITPRDFGCTSIAVGVIDQQLLREWFEKENHTDDLPANVSLVLESICDDSRSSKQPIPEKVKQYLLSYSEIPDYPRLIYLLFYPETDEHFNAVLRNELEDEALSEDDLDSLVRFRTNLVIALLDKNTVHFSNQRRDAITRIIKSLPVKGSS